MAMQKWLVGLSGSLLAIISGNALYAELPNGVAAGDTTSDSSMLWTRSTTVGDVLFEVATDNNFTNIVGQATVAVVNPLVPVKVDITGLLPGTEYFYRATNSANVTDAGIFKTPYASGKNGLHFGITGDWQQAPPYPALSNAAGKQLDFFLKLGDTIYADTPTPDMLPYPAKVQARTLEDFRIKHAEVLSMRDDLGETVNTNPMLSLYRSTTIRATIDDHELVDNFAGGAAPADSPDAEDVHPGEPTLYDNVPFVNQTQTYQWAMQAFDEYHPTRTEVWSGTGDVRVDGRPKLYRHQNHGSDASVAVLDSRSFRDAQVAPVANPLDPGAVSAFLASTFAPERTLLGKPQLAQLKADLLADQAAGVTWKFVVIPEPIQNFGVVNAEDRFEGYAAERTELLAFIDQAGIENVVFLAGDFHGTIINNLAYQVPTANGLVSVPTNAFEIVTGPAAFFNGTFGPAVVNIAENAGLVAPGTSQLYNMLPIAPDTSDTDFVQLLPGVFLPNDRDDFIEALINAQTSPLGYDPVGLDNNLPNANLIDATLLQGDYVVANTFSWAEFEIDALTQVLTVNIWGVDAFPAPDTLDALLAASALTPRLLSQFSVTPVPEPATVLLLGLPLVGLMSSRRR